MLSVFISLSSCDIYLVKCLNEDEHCDIVAIDNNNNGNCSMDHTEATIKGPAFNQVLTQ